MVVAPPLIAPILALAINRIATSPPALSLQGYGVLDATGLVLAPGFIDVHTHDDREVLDAPTMLPKLTRGVTTCHHWQLRGIRSHLAGGSHATSAIESNRHTKGLSLCQRADYVKAIKQSQPAVNVGVLIGHSTLRVNAVSDLTRGAIKMSCNACKDCWRGRTQRRCFRF